MHRQKVVVENIDQDAGKFAVRQRNALATLLEYGMGIGEVIDEVMASDTENAGLHVDVQKVIEYERAHRSAREIKIFRAEELAQ